MDTPLEEKMAGRSRKEKEEVVGQSHNRSKAFEIWYGDKMFMNQVAGTRYRADGL